MSIVTDKPKRLRQGVKLVTCPKCGGRCYAKGGNERVTFYYCERKCGYSKKEARP